MKFKQQKKLINEVIGVAKNQEIIAKVIIVVEENNGNRRNTMKCFDIVDSQQKAMLLPALPDVGNTRSLELLGLFAITVLLKECFWVVVWC
jgi:hypothetical protein